MGDLLSLIPIIHHEFLTTGKKPTLVVAKAYRQIPEALDYINTLVFDGDMYDLEGAIKFAKSQCDDVKVCQLHGKGFEFQHRHPSFQYDQWDRAGALDKWDTLPLVLPRHVKSKPIVDLLSAPISFILYGDHSQSSPFLLKEDLAAALRENFPQHQIVRLSSIRAPHALELLALIDAADLFISVDSMPLHLAKASKTPLIALISDMPSRWQGSAWSRRFAMHCRYKDFPRRKDELIRVAKAAIEGTPHPKVTPVETNRWGYNPSIIQHGESLITVHRYHPTRTWKTRLAISDGKSISDIKFPQELDEFTKEDARLFHHQGKLMLTYVMAKAEPISNVFKSVIGYGMLVQREGVWHLEKHYQPNFRNNDWSGMAKNWCPFESEGKIHFIWGSAFNEQIVIQIDGANVVKEIKAPEPKWDYGEIRGGAIVPYDGKLLRFFHSRTGEAHWGRHGTFQYHVGAMLMDAETPFKRIQIGKYPILSGDERYVPGCFHWKPGVIFPGGCVRKGDKFLLSVGRNDSSAEIVELTEKDLNL